ncbi:hypothetical protein FJ366_03215 [Candidatus Dependentiae bacterium]|nr:hypothetical protein [Candidatus Dependentiae bacterium]
MNQLTQYGKIFTALVLKEFRLFWSHRSEIWLNIFFEVVLWLLIETFVMPSFGAAYNYGQFMLANILIMQFVMLAMSDVSVMVDDLCSNKQISFQLGLALPSELVFIRYALSTSIKSFVYTVCALPVALLVVYARGSFVSFSLLKLLSMFFLGSLFFGVFMLWMASFTKNLVHYEDLWVRMVSPLWMMGGALFPWVLVQKNYPFLAKILLLNPFLYIMEGARSAILGHHQYISYATCVMVIICSILIIGFLGVRGMKKRLDTF